MNLINIIDNYSNTERIVHIYKESKISYKELKNLSEALASYIIEFYQKDKTPIIVYGHKEHEMLICFLACVRSGHAYIPIDSSLPDERVKDIINNSGAKLAFGVSELTTNTNGISVLNLNEIREILEKYKGKKPNKEFILKPEDNFYIIYTSGSTGIPKGVQITALNLESFIKWGSGLCNLDEKGNYIFMNQAPFSFDLSVMDLYICLFTGSTLFSIDKDMISNIGELFKNFSKSGINIWVSTPSFAELCLSDKKFNEELLPNLETLLFCGEILSNSCVKRLHERFAKIKVINTYGPTEATVAVTSIKIDSETNNMFEPLPVGSVKDDCKIIILDNDGNPTIDGEKGEILIAGNSVSPGYYRNSQLTKEYFSYRTIDGKELWCYKTGDEGYVKEGNLYFCGRKDFQIKLNGYRIELEDIENNLRKLEVIDNSIVLPAINNSKINHLVAFVTLNRVIDDTEFKIGLMIKKELKKLLPEYMVPRKIVIKESLPMTINGKVNRKALLEEIK